jgi:proteic killer suppression protein
MIKTFKSKPLKELFETGKAARIDQKFHARLILVLDVVNRSANTQAMSLPGFNLHPLKQYKPWKWSIWISGAWRLTFEFDKGDAYRVDFEQYH